MTKQAGIGAVPSVKVNPVADQDSKNLLPISEAEHVNLILEATPENVIAARFGPGWVALESTLANRWAIRRIAEMRGITINSPKGE